MSTEIWLALVSILVTLVGCLGALGYRDIARRLGTLERQDGKLIAAILTLLMAKPNDTQALAEALHGLISNGITHIGGD